MNNSQNYAENVFVFSSKGRLIRWPYLEVFFFDVVSKSEPRLAVNYPLTVSGAGKPRWKTIRHSSLDLLPPADTFVRLGTRQEEAVMVAVPADTRRVLEVIYGNEVSARTTMSIVT